MFSKNNLPLLAYIWGWRFLTLSLKYTDKSNEKKKKKQPLEWLKLDKPVCLYENKRIVDLLGNIKITETEEYKITKLIKP